MPSALLDLPPIVRVKLLADLLGVTQETIRKWAATGVLPPARRLGCRILYWHAEEVRAFIREGASRGK